MTEHDLFQGILSDVTLYQTNKSQYLSYFFNNVLQHDHHNVKRMPLPWPPFPKAHNKSWLVLFSMHPPQLWFFHVDRLCLLALCWTVPKNLGHFALEIPPKKKSHAVESRGLGSHSGSYFNAVTLWLKSSLSLLQQLCVDDQVYHPASTINAWKLLLFKVLVQVRVNFFIYHLEIPFTIEIAVFRSPELNLQALSDDRQNQLRSVIAMTKSGTEALRQGFMKPPVTSHSHQ